MNPLSSFPDDPVHALGVVAVMVLALILFGGLALVFVAYSPLFHDADEHLGAEAGFADYQPDDATDPDDAAVTPVVDAEWDALLAFIEAARHDLLSLDMDGLVADSNAVRKMLRVVSTFPPAADCTAVEELLLVEHKRIETEIARRLIGGATHPRYATPDTAA